MADHPGDEQRIRSAYLVGCDGGRSVVRAGLGIGYGGEGGLAEFVSVHFRAPELMSAHSLGPANMHFPLHRDHAGYLINGDRDESWTYHLQLPPAERSGRIPRDGSPRVGSWASRAPHPEVTMSEHPRPGPTLRWRTRISC